MNAFKQFCISLRKRDYTINEISQITRRPKTSVYFHVRGIPLSTTKQSAIANSYRLRATQLAANKKGRSTRSFNTFVRWDKNTVFIVAHFLFDGEIRRGCSYNNRNLALIHELEKRMRSIYQFEPKRYLNRTTGVYRISYYNVAFGAYVQKKATELLRRIKYLSPKLQIEFVRSFFDDEGCVDFRPSKKIRRIRGYQKNLELLKTVRALLESFQISSRIIKPNEVVISGKKNLFSFQQKIGFSKGVRINGKRANSIWRQSLEKRVILKRAIASFKV